MHFKNLRALKFWSTNNLEINHLTSCTAEIFIFCHLGGRSFRRRRTAKGLFQVHSSSRYISLARIIFTSFL